MDVFAPYLKLNGCFIVQNTSPQVKTIKIFNYPINYGMTRDLLQIPGVAEQDIRASLLKGELNHKIRARDIVVICSDIDLIQFNSSQKAFLQSAGIVNGLDAGNAMPFLFKQNMALSGTLDGINRVFTTPDKFIQGTLDGNFFSIMVFHNGQELIPNIDFTVSESGGVGTGYDTITFISFVPNSNSTLVATYVTSI